MIRWFFNLALVVITVFAGYQLYNLYRQDLLLEKELAQVNGYLDVLDVDNKKLRSDIVYFQKPENLEKEARSRFNYATAKEKLIVVVPKKI